MELRTLDAHAHISPTHSTKELEGAGMVLAMSLSLDEASAGLAHEQCNVAWGVGCHPRFPRAQETFTIQRFKDLISETFLVGEVGLDSGSGVPMELQLKNFRQILDVLTETRRLVSIHSYRASGLVLRELQHYRLTGVPVLHWWTGSAEDTCEAVRLGCYFSIHSNVARQSKFRTHVPLERILVESDHGYHDPPAAIPCRIEWVEHLVGQQYQLEQMQVREQVWRNMATIIHRTGIAQLMPSSIAAPLSEMKPLN